MSGNEQDYVHGYTAEERERLVSQSEFLESGVYRDVDFHAAATILEIGCGVGAQLRILARRFPHARLTGIDRSASQLARARELLAPEIAAGRVTLLQAEGERLPLADGKVDAVFLCWVLEHVKDPDAVLAEARRLLAPGGKLVVTEVFNATLFVRPASPALVGWWQALSDYQEELGGDPYIGVQLGTRLTRAGFRDVGMRPIPFPLDGRATSAAERARHVGYWRDLFKSAAPGLVAAGRRTEADWRQVETEFARLERDHDAVFYVAAMQAEGRG